MKDRASIALLFLATVFILIQSARSAHAQAAAAQDHQMKSSASTEIEPTMKAGKPSNTAAAQPAPKSFVLAPGSMLLAEFSKSLNAKKLKPGDKVKAVLAQDLIAGGKIVAKSESKMVGHVTEVKARTVEDPESRLGVVFDKILLKHHREIDFRGVVLALGAPALRRSRVDEPDQMLPPAVGVVSTGNNGAGPATPMGGRASRSANTIASTVPTWGVPVSVQSTPGSNPGDSVSTIKPAAVGNRPITGGSGVHGVYGLKNLSLSPSATGTGPGPVIVSKKSNVKLESGTQVVLLVK